MTLNPGIQLERQPTEIMGLQEAHNSQTSTINNIPMAWRNSRDSTFMKHNSPHNCSAQPEARDPTSIADSSNITRNIYMVSVCWLLFAQGWNDASTGPLLHVAQAFYRLNFTMISMLFVCSTVGYISGAIANVAFTDVFGFGKLIAAGSFVQLIGYAIMAVGPPFAVMCLGYAITGFALAIQNAQGNTFVTQLPGKVSNNMAILHSAYGVGALVAPLVATQFTLLPRWTYFFFVSLGIAFVSLVLSVSVFRFQRAEGLLANISPRPSIATQQTAETEAFEDNAEQKNKYHQVFKQKSTHLLALFLMVYVGVEVTLGGWIVTFLIELRGGGVSAGYVSSGFFAGLTLGRLVLLPVTKFIGISRVVYVYSVLAMGFELIVWFVPNLITNAVAVAIVGLVLAPLYPITMNVASQVLPPWVLAGSIGWIAAVGQAGSAIFPFITGVLATRYGVQILQPLVMVMLFITMIIWTMFALVNNTRLKAD